MKLTMMKTLCISFIHVMIITVHLVRRNTNANAKIDY
jgi:hypothetical protein